MNGLATRTIQKTKTLTIIQRIAEKDKTAFADCLDTYGDFIWTLARKFTNSREEAETATQDIFNDIWQYAENGDQIQSAEKFQITLIARRRLIKYL